MAIVNLDNDDFDDLVVGAPFLDANRGAIFVYRGKSRLEDIRIPSQVIKAEDLGHRLTLQRFGHVLIGGQDLNGDG